MKLLFHMARLCVAFREQKNEILKLIKHIFFQQLTLTKKKKPNIFKICYAFEIKNPI